MEERSKDRNFLQMPKFSAIKLFYSFFKQLLLMSIFGCVSKASQQLGNSCRGSRSVFGWVNNACLVYKLLQVGVSFLHDYSKNISKLQSLSQSDHVRTKLIRSRESKYIPYNLLFSSLRISRFSTQSARVPRYSYVFYQNKIHFCYQCDY